MATNFTDFVTSVEEEAGCYEFEGEDSTDNLMMAIPTSVFGNYEVLTENEDIISIVQYFIHISGSGGNLYILSSSTLNIDLKENKIISNDIVKFDDEKLKI